MRPLNLWFATAVVAATAALCAGQNITSAKSGTLHFFTGDVSIDGTEVQRKAGLFPEVKPGSVLRTGQGKAEMLLTPGVFLRLDDNTAVRMLDADLTHTRVEIVSGSVMAEADDPHMSVKNAPVTLVYGDYEVRLVKHGLVGISADAGQVKVYRGKAEVADGTQHVTLKDGRYAQFAGELRAEKFDRKVPDDLYAWSRDRSADLSAANMYSAGTLNGTYGYGYNSATPWGGGWYYNSWFNTFTFVPASGTLWNPWGYGFYSPGSIFGFGGPPIGWYNPVLLQPNNSIGRSLNGNPNLTVPQSSITRQLGGGTGTAPALGSPVRGGSPGPHVFSPAPAGPAGGFGASRGIGGGGSFGGGGGIRGGGGGFGGGAIHGGGPRGGGGRGR